MRTHLGTALGVVLLLAIPARAEEQTVTLAVEGMWCAGCAYIVEQTLARVQGVRDVDVSMQEKVAVVTFDDEETTVAVFTEATASMGFPSTAAR